MNLQADTGKFARRWPKGSRAPGDGAGGVAVKTSIFYSQPGNRLLGIKAARASKMASLGEMAGGIAHERIC